MKIPDNTIKYIEDEIDRLDKGEIIVELNIDRKKIDVQTISGNKSDMPTILEDIKKAAAEIHHGRIIIKLNGKDVPPVIDKVKRERFEENKKK